VLLGCAFLPGELPFSRLQELFAQDLSSLALRKVVLARGSVLAGKGVLKNALTWVWPVRALLLLHRSSRCGDLSVDLALLASAFLVLTHVFTLAPRRDRCYQSAIYLADREIQNRDLRPQARLVLTP
jgi:hypothetical protein